MTDMSQLNVQGAPVGVRAGSRVVVTEDVRVSAASGAGAAAVAAPAIIGSGAGKPLPEFNDPHNAQRRQRAEADARERVQEAIAHLNDYAQSIQRDLHFFVDEGSGRSIVQVIDRTTQEVVRQIPSDVALRLARNLKLQPTQYASDAGMAANAAGSGLALIDTRI